MRQWLEERCGGGWGDALGGGGSGVRGRTRAAIARTRHRSRAVVRSGGKGTRGCGGLVVCDVHCKHSARCGCRVERNRGTRSTREAACAQAFRASRERRRRWWASRRTPSPQTTPSSRATCSATCSARLIEILRGARKEAERHRGTRGRKHRCRLLLLFRSDAYRPRLWTSANPICGEDGHQQQRRWQQHAPYHLTGLTGKYIP